MLLMKVNPQNVPKQFLKLMIVEWMLKKKRNLLKMQNKLKKKKLKKNYKKKLMDYLKEKRN